MKEKEFFVQKDFRFSSRLMHGWTIIDTASLRFQVTNSYHNNALEWKKTKLMAIDHDIAQIFRAIVLKLGNKRESLETNRNRKLLVHTCEKPFSPR